MNFLRLFALLSFLLSAASCSQDAMLEKPREYRTVTAKPERRSNDKSRFRKEHHRIGLGIDLNARNPYKYRTVNAPKPYKYSRPK
ncbi:hypothetical protein [Hymenobacter weizhouensis]|uniref:hypothetical protein n=1 Tax=Hymenobacter sp. YIM 151500-1 TaxID=2987689 RepID=UPI00222620D7|nr:hypothetical protein [Hymenobacter sp. YIM 151500-1]UYZ64782.1 hypothetical protein OIS53_08015 [Hymenobacter sp. YIM 151500-1]